MKVLFFVKELSISLPDSMLGVESDEVRIVEVFKIEELNYEFEMEPEECKEYLEIIKNVYESLGGIFATPIPTRTTGEVHVVKGHTESEDSGESPEGLKEE